LTKLLKEPETPHLRDNHSPPADIWRLGSRDRTEAQGIGCGIAAMHAMEPVEPAFHGLSLLLSRRIVRYVSPLTTTVYTHPSDEELFSSVLGLKC